MFDEIAQKPLSHAANPQSRHGRSLSTAARAVVEPARCAAAAREISAWPGFAPTPLADLPGLSAAAGIARIAVKDEGARFGLGSFKALGGAYAVLCQIKARIAAMSGTQASSADILAGKHKVIARAMTVCCATDGNHGRSVAWGARMFGAACVIYIHEHVSKGREDAIAAFGAKVRRVAGTYDDSVRRAAGEAAAQGWTVISDTSYEGYMDIPRDVMAGYGVMADEALEQWRGPADAPAPSHVFVQAGVGGVAAAVCARLDHALGAKRPRFVAVEPERAACLFASVREGRAASIGGDLDTMMAGLAAGDTSVLAWDVLNEGADDFLIVSDDSVAPAMRLLAGGVAGDPPLVAGESAVAGLAGLLGALARPEVASALELGPDSRVLLFLTEGDTDPELYTRIAGRSGDAVRGI